MSFSYNFAQSFMPERMFLGKLLKMYKQYETKVDFLDDTGYGDIPLFQAVSYHTGIPTGTSSGKVKPHIDYLCAMGLVSAMDDWCRLTDFGEIVLREDHFLDERLTMLAAHGMICDGESGSLLHADIVKLLQETGPMAKAAIQKQLDLNSRALSSFISMYSTGSSFGKANVIRVSGDIISIDSVPLISEFIPMYGAVVVQLFANHFDGRGQVSISEFESKTYLSARYGLTKDMELALFDKLSSSGYVRLSALVDPPVFSISISEQDAWRKLYDNLI